ncbi:MAG: acyltransferase [Bacteroidales bacterium]
MTNRLRRAIRQLINYHLPNLRHKTTVVFKGKHPTFNQRTIFTGEGRVEIGDICMFGYQPGGFHHAGQIELQARTPNSTITVGRDVLTNNNIFIVACNNITIGERTIIGQYVTIMDHEAHGTHPEQRRQMGQVGEVTIGQNVWIGNNVVILKNTNIGDNCIVAAGAVVSGQYPANCIIGGVPAKVIRDTLA